MVVVLSAMGKYTDELIAKAKDINPNPPKREMDMLFTIGEQMSVSLMAMAMAQLGVRAVSLNAFQVPDVYKRQPLQLPLLLPADIPLKSG